jgi:hypothetical protein
MKWAIHSSKLNQETSKVEHQFWKLQSHLDPLLQDPRRAIIQRPFLRPNEKF